MPAIEKRPNGPEQEPSLFARAFVYAFVFTSPVLVLAAAIVPAAVFVRLNETSFDVAGAAAAGVAVAGLLLAGLRGVRSLTPRFVPPLPLPGDIWNMGVSSPSRRSSNWPIRLFRRRPAIQA